MKTTPETALSTQATPWTLILSAQSMEANSVVRRECLERIFGHYRRTIIRFFRMFGFHDQEDREDLAQEFFLRFIEKDLLNRLDRERGSFRAYLKAVARRFVHDVRHREKGRHPLAGTQAFFPASGDAGMEEYPDPDLGAADVFDRQWARDTLELALAHFRHDCEERSLSHWLTVFERHTLPTENDAPRPTLAESAAFLNLTIKQVEAHLTRANACFRDHLRRVIRMTVATDAEVEGEMADLRTILSDGKGAWPSGRK
jgi:RNA polymerase sigma factor (sigma-70 family)